jgi:hypothetical protein
MMNETLLRSFGEICSKKSIFQFHFRAPLSGVQFLGMKINFRYRCVKSLAEKEFDEL